MDGKRGEICLLITPQSLGKDCTLGKLNLFEVKLNVNFSLCLKILENLQVLNTARTVILHKINSCIEENFKT